MNLHHDRESFSELVTAASSVMHIPPNIIEKDYYMILTLKEPSSKIKGMVFKGGTSLAKCFHPIDRFSEDIDISYAASDNILGESRKRQLMKSIVAILPFKREPILANL